MTPNCQSISDCKHYLAIFSGVRSNWTKRKYISFYDTESLTTWKFVHKTTENIAKLWNCIHTLPGQIFDMEWRPFSPINKLPINTQVKATVATNQNSSFNNPRTITARWLHMHALMEPYIKKLQNNHNISFSYKSFEFHSSGT